MCTLLAKLAIGLSATVATGFYYLAAAPPSAATNVCGPGNYSTACARDNTPSPSESSQPVQSPASADSVQSPAPDPLPNPVVPDPLPNPVVPLPNPLVPDPVPSPVPSPVPDPLAGPIPNPAPILPPPPNLPDIYKNPRSATSIPEPGTVIALLLTGAGMIYSGRKRNKGVDQQR